MQMKRAVVEFQIEASLEIEVPVGSTEKQIEKLAREAVQKEALDELTRLRSENERLLNSVRIIRNDLAALVPVPSADDPQWPEFFSDADYECLTLALKEARAAVELSKEPSKEASPLQKISGADGFLR